MPSHSDCRVSLGPAFPVQNAIGIHVDLRKLPTKRSSPFIHYSNKAKRRKQTAESRAASIPEGTASLHSSLNYSTGFSLLPLQASACSLYRQEAARGWRQSAECRVQRQCSDSIFCRHHPLCPSVAVANTAGILEIQSTEGFTDVQNVGRECIGIVESQLLVLQEVQSLYSAFPAGRCRMVSSCLL